MDERQIREIAKKIFQMMQDKQIISNTDASTLPIAYVLLSEGWQQHDTSLFNDLIESLKETHRCVLVLPEESDREKISQVGNCSIVLRDDVAEPAEGSVSFFPVPCRDLIVKTALCLSDDFGSRWVRECIEQGTPVYMRKETPMFTGKESVVYQRKVRAYYQDVESYGVEFFQDHRQVKLVREKSNESKGKQKRIKKYITMTDLENVDAANVFRMQEGDTFTALAKEHIEKLGIQVMVE